jgi:CDP-glucose 4,6-dehydratase
MGFWKCSLANLGMSFWKGKRVLITGNTGFKGTWLSLFLQKLGASLQGIALKPAEVSAFNLCKLDGSYPTLYEDICNREALYKVQNDFQPEIVFHMAAQPLVTASYQDPIETYRVNVLGTATVLDILKDSKSIQSIIVITTDKCYENNDLGVPFKESDQLGGNDPYSASKACTEIVANSYRSSFFDPSGIGLATARAGNVIGGGDFSAKRLVPDILEASNNGNELELRYPNAIRPWQHVFDVLWGYLVLAEKLTKDFKKFSSGWNFGPSERSNLTVLELVKMFYDLGLNSSLKWSIADDASIVKEANSLLLNSTKANKHLSWINAMSIEQSIQSIIDWNHSYIHNLSLLETSRKQVESYLENILK